MKYQMMEYSYLTKSRNMVLSTTNIIWLIKMANGLNYQKWMFETLMRNGLWRKTLTNHQETNLVFFIGEEQEVWEK